MDKLLALPVRRIARFDIEKNQQELRDIASRIKEIKHQNYSRSGMEYCLQKMIESSRQAGTLISFSETHDNDRLADSGKTFARFRLLACALLSTEGAFGFANGAEFYAKEKIDVHKDCALNFGAGEHLCALTGTLNELLNVHPAFIGNSQLRSVSTRGGETMAFLRSDAENQNKVLILLNPDCSHSQQVHFPGELPDEGIDLLSGKQIIFHREGAELTFDLPPGSGFAVSFEKSVWLRVSMSSRKNVL